MISAKGSLGSEFKVGNIVYFISSKTEQVIPALVAEKITRSSLDVGVRVTYVLKVRQGKSFKSIEVDPQKIELFEDPADVKTFMLERTEQAIDKLVATATEAAAHLRPPKPPAEEVVTAQAPDINLDMPADESIEVALPDGRTAKLRM